MGVDFSELRQRMVNNQIRTVGIVQFSVLSAFMHVPREEFVPQDIKNLAYIDESIIVPSRENTGFSRYIMAPARLARLVQLADVVKTDSVLDIGANMGYCAAVLSLLAKSVVALEKDSTLTQLAAEALTKNCYDNVTVITGPLTMGYAIQAPYDVILIEGAVDFIPPVLFRQMREGSRLVVVEGHGNAGTARLYVQKNNVISICSSFNLAVKPLPCFLEKAKFIF
ncbi:MAG: protein-L-isoaspartate(D-aspartate) O-methyltransferase [Candidatus Tokpelaia sp. JSC085]|nr:MAG: protein-L-isoaspartate(D-aspartate) O-methyltransferase [Candidatus Tokpelaia sp. JSC085]